MKQYKYEFSDGTIGLMTPDEAVDYEREHGCEIFYSGQIANLCCNFIGSRMGARKRDGFKPGWQPQLGMEVNSRQEYDKILRKKGYVEMGNERPKVQGKEEKERKRREKIVNEVNSMTGTTSDISDRETKAFIDGEKLHKN